MPKNFKIVCWPHWLLLKYLELLKYILIVPEYFFYFLVLGIEPRASCVLDEYSFSLLPPQSSWVILEVSFIEKVLCDTVISFDSKATGIGVLFFPFYKVHGLAPGTQGSEATL